MRTSVRKTGAKRQKSESRADAADTPAGAKLASTKVAKFDAFGREGEETRQDTGLLQRGFAMIEALSRKSAR